MSDSTDLFNFEEFEDYYIKEKWLKPSVDINTKSMKESFASKPGFIGPQPQSVRKYPINKPYNQKYGGVTRDSRLSNIKSNNPYNIEKSMSLGQVEDRYIFGKIGTQKVDTSYRDFLHYDLLHPKGFENLNQGSTQLRAPKEDMTDPRQNIHYFDLNPQRAAYNRRKALYKRQNIRRYDTKESHSLLGDSFSNQMRSFDVKTRQITNSELGKKIVNDINKENSKYTSLADQYNDAEDNHFIDTSEYNIYNI
jgi:hypothetical protein